MPGYDVTERQLKEPAHWEGLKRYICPVCTGLLRDAVQPSCGHWLCQSCAEDLFSNGSHPICPRDDCKEQLVPDGGQEFFPDRFVRREISNLKLSCTNKDSGCPWDGILSSYESHLDQCIFKKEFCRCGQWILSSMLDDHRENDCPNSRKVCPLAVLGCPMKNKMTKKELQSHIGSYPAIVDHMEMMALAFSSFQDKLSLGVPKRPPGDGADVASIRSDSCYSQSVEKDGLTKQKGVLTSVLKVDAPTGQSEDSYQVSSQVMQHVEHLVEKETKKMREKYEQEIEKRDCEIQELRQMTTHLQKNLQGKKVEIDERDFRLSLIENSNYDGTMVWKIPQFNQRMNDAKSGKYTSIFSLPFYSGRYGYKMCLRLYIMGDGIGKNKFMSLFFVIMKGDYDNILPWPFTGRVAFSLISQKPGGRDIVDTFQPDPTSSSFQKPQTDMNIASGCPQFISHDNLMKGGYIENDTVFIKCNVDRSSMRHP